MKEEVIAKAVEPAYQIAAFAHAINRAYREGIGEDPGPTWEQLDPETQRSAVNGVEYVLQEPDNVTPRSLHESWKKFKVDNGWSYGPVKDLDKREHPCIVPYEELPTEQRVKDNLFLTVVLQCSSLLTTIWSEIMETDQIKS